MHITEHFVVQNVSVVKYMSQIITYNGTFEKIRIVWYKIVHFKFMWSKSHILEAIYETNDYIRKH